MPTVRIEVIEDGEASVTINIPAWFALGASKLLPRLGGKSLQDYVEVEQLMAVLKDPPESGGVLDIHDHQGGDRVVISIVGDARAG